MNPRARHLRPRDRDAPLALREWVRTRPPDVQKLAREFPAGIVITDQHGDDWYVMGYVEGDDAVLIVPEWPWPGSDRYDRVMAARQTIHAAHLRDGSVPVKRQA